MRLALLLLAACGPKIIGVEEIRPAAATWDEECIQRELRCLYGSRSGGGVIVTALAPFALFADATISGEAIVRACKLQGDLCRVRSGVAAKTADPR
jgi:hypothetical protein